MTNTIKLKEQASAPPSPQAGYQSVYIGSDHELHRKNSSGSVTDIEGGGGGSPILTADVPITNAELLALKASPKTIVPTPGAGLVIAPHILWLILDSAAGAYVTGGGAGNKLYLGFVDGLQNADELFDPAGAGTDGFNYYSMDEFTSSGHIGNNSTIADRAGQPLKITYNGNAELTGGNVANGLRVVVLYSVLPTVIS